MILFPKSYQHRLPETITTYLYLKLSMNTSQTLFFYPLLLSGISSMLIFEIRNRLVLLINKSLNLSDQFLIVRLMCIILMELNDLQDYELGWVICVNTNLDTIFKTPYTHSATVVSILKQLFTSFSTAQITQIKEKLFLKKLVASNVLYWPKMVQL